MNDHFTAQGLADAVMGIVLSDGGPSFVETQPGEPLEAVAAWWPSPDLTRQPKANHLASAALPARLEESDLAGLRMTATLDASTPSLPSSLLDRAAALAEPGALQADNAEQWFALWSATARPPRAKPFG